MQHALNPTRCYVASPNGCIVRQNPSLQSPLICELPHRSVLHADCIAKSNTVRNTTDARIHIFEPVDGYVSLKCIDFYPKAASEPILEPSAAKQHLGTAAFLATPAFSGPRQRAFFGKSNGRLGYHRDLGQPLITTCKQITRRTVVGLNGAIVRSGPALWFPIVGMLPFASVVEVDALFTTSKILNGADFDVVRARVGVDRWVSEHMLSNTNEHRTESIAGESEHIIVHDRTSACHKLVDSGQFRWRFTDEYTTEPVLSKSRDKTEDDPGLLAEPGPTRWLAQKLALKQDALFFVANNRHRCPRLARQLARDAATRTERGFEYLSLHCDTTEADLKQRPELHEGDLIYIDQPTLRAARAGSILVLDGIDLVEANVLPALNNLLAFRQIVLDDGSCLTADPRFAVIAIAYGPVTEPTLRSRFSAWHLQARDEAQSINSFAATLAEALDAVDAPSRPDAAYLSARLDIVLASNPSAHHADVLRRAYPHELFIKSRRHREIVDRVYGGRCEKSLPTLHNAILEDLNAGLPTLIVGPRESGKSFIAQRVAENENAIAVLCHEDFRARELLQDHQFDKHTKSTTWQNSIILERAQYGGLVLLEEIDTLPTGLLLVLSRILIDRRLPNGTRVHKDFRVLATAVSMKADMTAYFQTHLLQDLILPNPDPGFEIYTSAVKESDTVRGVALAHIGNTLTARCKTFTSAITPVIEYARLALPSLQCLAMERAIALAQRHSVSTGDEVSQAMLIEERHVLLCGTQGVGKNLLAAKLYGDDYVYIQLGRDSTIHQLLVSSSLSHGAVETRDAPFLQAIRQGKSIVVDEADKAPRSVLRFLRAIALDHNIEVGDGRRWRQVRSKFYRLAVLANPTGGHFRGITDSFLELRGAFYPYVVKSPSTTALARALLPAPMADRLVILFTALVKANTGYPYSARDLIKVGTHCAKNAEDINDLIPALTDVTALDDAVAPIRFKLDAMLADHAKVESCRHEDEWEDDEIILWMVQKAELKQHIGLLCEPPCTRGRRLALQFCALTDRTIEFLDLTVDSTEADLIQRRELVDGSVIFVDQPAIRAARQGKVLLVRGLHLVNSNVIALLHNLLEHQTLTLTDGSSIDPRTISPEFLVIAVHHCVSKFQSEGRDLDPTLRSRFAWKNFVGSSSGDRIGSVIKSLRAAWDPTSLVHLDSKLPEWRRRQVLQTRPSGALQRWPPRIDSILKLEAAFPTLHLSSLIRRTCQQSPDLEAALDKLALTSEENVPLPNFAPGPRPLLDSGEVLFEGDEVDDDGLTHLQRRQLLGGHSYLLVKKIVVSKDEIPEEARVVFDDGTTVKTAIRRRKCSNQDEFQNELSGSQQRILSAMLQDHCAGADIHLIGERGVGKMTLVREFAAALGYGRPRIVMCHSEMIAMDLLARRIINGSKSEWIQGPVVEAAVNGDLLVFDGVHRLARGLLAAILEPLVTDRILCLPDGTRLVSDTMEKSNLHINPAFRIICTSCNEQKSDWMGLFHSHFVQPWSQNEQFELLVRKQIPAAEARALLAFGEASRRLAESEPALKPLLLTTRMLIAVTDVYAKQKGSIKAAVSRIFAGFHRDKIFDALVQQTLTISNEKVPAVLNPLVRKSVAPCIRIETNQVMIGDIACMCSSPRSTKQFVDVDVQLWLLRDLLVDWTLGNHLLILGSQGIGKNTIIEKFLDLLGHDCEYLHLHRDANFAWLTSARRLRANAIVIEDPPLVRAAIKGQVLVVDEVDKAPPVVLWVLRTLALGRDLDLEDGRRLVFSSDKYQKEGCLRVCDSFRIVLLANQFGYPFAGRDVYRDVGDVFASHQAPSLDRPSQIRLLRAFERDTPVKTVAALCAAWDELRQMHEVGRLGYTTSPREAIKVLAHLSKFPSDDPMQVVEDILAFDAFDTDLHVALQNVMRRHLSVEKLTSSPTAVVVRPTKNGVHAEARRARLHEAQTTEAEANAYKALLAPRLKRQIDLLRNALDQRRQQSNTGRWLRFQVRGDLDEHALVECALGSERIYKCRERVSSASEDTTNCSRKKTRIALVLDLSGSMYANDSVDGRLRRCVECALLMIEACRGLQDTYEYAVYGHSGATSALEVIPFGAPPTTERDTLAVVQRMIEHARTCKSGDKTVAAVRRAVKAVVRAPAKEYLVFLVSDADFTSSYGESAQSLRSALSTDARVATFAFFVASENRSHIEALCRELTVGRGTACYETEDLVSSLRQAFLHSTCG